MIERYFYKWYSNFTFPDMATVKEAINFSSHSEATAQSPKDPNASWSKLERILLFGSTEDVGGRSVCTSDLFFERAHRLIPDPGIREAVTRHLLKVTSEGETVEQARESRKGICKQGVIVYALDPSKQVELKTTEGIGVSVEASGVDDEGYAVPEWPIRVINFQGEPLPDQSLLDTISVVRPQMCMIKKEDGSRVLAMKKAA